MKRGRQSNALDNSTNKAARFTPCQDFRSISQTIKFMNRLLLLYVSLNYKNGSNKYTIKL